jgi:antitoxin (DNA-binding transcriptional repressor) of toxin-antitoxin stability system
MTISEARAVLPEVVSRVAAGEEITITRHGKAAAVVVRPDVVWTQAGSEVLPAETADLAAALRERARRHGHTLEQELRMILDTAIEPDPQDLPPIQLITARTDGRSTWSREDIYDDEGR